MASDVEVDSNILYDLSVHNEWLQEPETVVCITVHSIDYLDMHNRCV